VAILEETGHDPVIAFTRILGDARMASRHDVPTKKRS
jgi:hypothetical protein